MQDYDGLFVVFEGGEGSGKSTQAERLANALSDAEIPHVLTREPGDTELGRELRKILLADDREPMSKKAEALLFTADRAEHVEKVILPALREGKVVVCDRYIASTIAHQSYGNGLDIETIRTLSDWASDGLYPDITFYLSIYPPIGLQRAHMRGKVNRIDAKGLEYHTAVRQGFDVQVDDTWAKLDARDSIHSIHQEVVARVKMVMQEKQRRLEEESSTLRKPHYCEDCRDYHPSRLV